MHEAQIFTLWDLAIDKLTNGDYNILKRISQGAVSLMIIVPQRGNDVNRKEEKIMKVKVRKRKPAPVAEEQVKDRTFGQIKKKHNFFEEFCFKNDYTVK